MRSTTVFSCVSLIAGLMATLPLNIYERGKSGRRLADDPPDFRIIHDNPNEAMSGFTWRELIGVALLLGGNHYAAIEMKRSGSIAGLYPIPRNSVQVFKTSKGRLRYRVQLADGAEEFDQSEILHIPGLGFDGVQGLSAIGNSRQAIGLSLAMEETMSRMHSNGIRPSGVVSAEEGYGKDPVNALRAIKSQFEGAYSGLSNAGKTIFLDKGMEWTPMQISPADAETLNHRRYQVADICRAFGVPPFMVGETDKTTSWGSGLEQQTIGFLTFSLQRWLCRIEAELNRKLLPSPRFYAEFDRDALLSMDAPSRSGFYASMTQNAGMTPNEVRRRLNLPDAAGGDQLFINSACVPISTFAARSDAKPRG